MIIGAILQTIFSSIDQVFYKKSLVYNPTNLAFRFYGILLEGLVGVFIYLFFDVDLTKIDLLLYVIGIEFLCLLGGYLNQKAYTKEKISVLMPYSKLDAVIVIVSSFLLFHDVSIFSFLISLLILFIVIFSNIDFKDFKLSKNVLYTILAKVIFGIDSLVIGLVLLKATSMDYFVMSRIGATLATFIPMLLIFNKIKLEDYKLPKKFFIDRYVSSGAWLIGFLIGLFLISELGLVVSTILGFLQMAMVLIISYFVFGDKPTKKDSILTIIITILVFIGFYFK